MKGKFTTKALNLAAYLARVYQSQGAAVFLAELDRAVGIVVGEAGGDLREVDRRLTSLATGLALSVFPGHRERAMQFVLELPALLSGEPSGEGRRKRFVEGFETVTRQAESSARRFSDQVLAYLKSCPLEKLARLTVDALAERFRFSAGHFSRKFQEEQGQTAHDALVYEKLNRAFALLSDPGAPRGVKEVSTLLGFSDHKYFRTLFRAKFGLNPSRVLRTDEPVPGDGGGD